MDSRVVSSGVPDQFKEKGTLQKINDSNTGQFIYNNVTNPLQNNVISPMSNALGNLAFNMDKPFVNNFSNKGTLDNAIITDLGITAPDRYGDLVTDTTYKRNPNVNYQSSPQVVNNQQQQPYNPVTIEQLTAKPASLNTLINTNPSVQDYLNAHPQNNQGQQNTQSNQVKQNVQSNHPQYTGPVQTLFGSANFGSNNNQGQQSNQYNTNDGNMFSNFKFNQDTYNQGLRDTSTKGYMDSRENYMQGADKLFSGSIGDMLSMSLKGNQYRQDMRKSQTDFTNANNLASQNLQQQNDNGLKDLINQRGSYFEQGKLNNDNSRLGLEQGRLDNDTSRLGLEQQRINQSQNQNNVDNKYKYDYLEQYLQPQMQNQVANQNATLNQQAQIHASDIQKGQLTQNFINGLKPTPQVLEQSKQNVLSSENGMQLKNSFDNGDISESFYKNQLNNLVMNDVTKDSQAQMSALQILNGTNIKNQESFEKETTGTDEKGNLVKKTVKGIGNGDNSISKNTSDGKSYLSPKIGNIFNN